MKHGEVTMDREARCCFPLDRHGLQVWRTRYRCPECSASAWRLDNVMRGRRMVCDGERQTARRKS